MRATESRIQTIVGIAGVLIAAVWFYLQVQEWKSHGHDYVPFLIHSLVSLALWGTAGYLIWSNRRALEKSENLETKREVGASPATSLRDKVIELARDLAAFLRELGPKPESHAEPWMSDEEILAQNADSRRPEQVHHGYMRRFRDRAVNLVHELGENGITNTGIENYQVDPPEIQREKELRNLVRQLFTLAANMEIENELGCIKPPGGGEQIPRGPRLLVANPDWMNLPGPMNSYGYFFRVTNDEHKRKTTARDIKVALHFQHIDGETRNSVGLWLVSSSSGMAWKKQMSISMGDDPKLLPLLYWGVDDASPVCRLIDANKMNVNPYGILLNIDDSDPLEPGEWEVTMKFTGDNLEEEWNTTVSLPAKGAIQHSPPIRRYQGVVSF